MGDALPADQLGLGFGGRGYVNRGLFADNFLENRLTELDGWPSTEEIGEAFGIIRRLYEDNAGRLPKSNEAQTERNFVQPVLNVLWGEEKRGECYEVQALLPGPQSSRHPDYAFFRHAADREAAESQKGTAAFWRDVPCLGDAKKWTASLDKKRGVDDNPSAQITRYMYQAHVRWGILTNGRIWRLYEREKSSAGGVYYEVDLERILRRSDVAAFKYLYVFFRRAAFLPDGDGRTFLDKVYQGSVDYAAEVGDRLKESVYDALRLLMNGFLENPANGLDRHDPEVLRSVHENSLVLLYRLLFLLYAEDRGLLPLQDPVYGDSSLKRLHKEISENLRSGRTYLPAEHRCWPELMRLFELIDNGLSHEGRVIVPAYNGGLFHPAKHPHIAYALQPDGKRWEIGDDRIAVVIDALAYRRDRWDEPGTQDIDYKTLDVQHLGSIYEGLLELQPCVAEEAMVEVSEGGKPTFKARREVAAPKSIRGQHPRGIGAGEAYLVTNRGERKATGSYYTPKYVVDYIVENTLGPLAEEAAERVADLRRDVDKAIAKLDRTRKQWVKSGEAGDREEADRHVADLAEAVEERKRGLLDPYLSLKVLDPAMGSGHFLVGAADFLSMAMATDPNLLPPETASGEDPQAYYKRLVVERCLYGVDLNPLAVELAKLSLWLHTVSKDKALSFLDHRLRCGNSLIGAQIEDLSREPPQFDHRGRLRYDVGKFIPIWEVLSATHLQYFLDTFRKIMETPTGDAEVEREKDGWYREMDATRDRFRAVANCWLSPYFGVSVGPQPYEEAVQALREWGGKAEPVSEGWFGDAQRVARDKRFFHWELEFPEVFFDAGGLKPTEERGFDAVIGNPPWEKIAAGAAQKRYLDAAFTEVREGEINFCTLFLVQSLRLSHRGGRMGELVPNTWLINKLDALLRKCLLENARVDHLFYMCKQVFPDAPDTIPAAVVMTKRNGEQPPREERVSVKVANDRLLGTPDFLRLPSWEDSGSQLAWYERPLHQMSVYDTARNSRCLARMESVGVSLGQVAHASDGIYKSTVDECRKGSRSLPTDRPVVDSGDQLTRYCIQWAGAFIPLDLWSQHSELHEGCKIVLHAARKPRLARRLVAGYTEEAIFFSNRFILVKCTHEAVSPFLLLALLNSLALNYYFKSRFPVTDVDGYMLHQLPVPITLSGEASSSLVDAVEAGSRLYTMAACLQDMTRVLGFAEGQLAAEPTRAVVVQDLIAFLAERMIKMNDERHSEETGFLTWLERAMGAEIDGLANKTRIKEYHESDLCSLLDVLRQNRRKLKVDPDSRPVQEKIEREFTASVSKLTPLKERVAATDWLIDQIVYKLYGLTEEEIRIVEGGQADPPGSPEATA